jgi:hypothetical protein
MSSWPENNPISGCVWILRCNSESGLNSTTLFGEQMDHGECVSIAIGSLPDRRPQDGTIFVKSLPKIEGVAVIAGNALFGIFGTQ